MSRVLALSLGLTALVLSGCIPICAGTSCDCPSNTTCAFNGCTSSTDSCNFNCQAGGSCTGSCGPNCNVTCGGKDCTHTVGAGSRIVCTAGTCNITCTGACSAVGVTSLTCQGGTAQSAAGCT